MTAALSPIYFEQDVIWAIITVRWINVDEDESNEKG